MENKWLLLSVISDSDLGRTYMHTFTLAHTHTQTHRHTHTQMIQGSILEIKSKYIFHYIFNKSIVYLYCNQYFKCMNLYNYNYL